MERPGNAAQWRRGKVSKKQQAKAFIAEIKSRAACADCKQHFHHVAMDFDHVRGSKRKAIADMVAVGCSVDSIMDEVAKCEVVCANCHRVRTFERLSRDR